MPCSFKAYCVIKEYVVFNLLCLFLWQAKLQVGDVVKCCIKKITYFGVFVEVTEKFSTHFLEVEINCTQVFQCHSLVP